MTFLLALVLVLLVLVLVGFVLGYNKIRTADVRVSEALSGIDVELTRRASLIPSLVHTVQTFAGHGPQRRRSLSVGLLELVDPRRRRVERPAIGHGQAGRP